MYNYVLNVIILLCISIYSNSYLISDVVKMEINILCSKNNTYNLPINIVDNNFKSKIIGLPHGNTKITVRGISITNKKLFEGVWEGNINEIDNDITINMLDLEINPKLIGEMPPYFNSINVIPSKINPGESARIIAYADDLNQNDANSLTYEVNGFEKYPGSINYINTNGKKLEFTYNSISNESLGIRNGIIKVSDNKYYSTAPISFKIDTINSINANIITSHKPKINFIKTDKTHIKFGDFAIISSNIFDEDNSPIEFIWSVNSLKGDCLNSDLIGQKSGTTSFNDLTIQYKPSVAQERKCEINLYINDNTNLNATGAIFIETNTQIINHSPVLIFGYQSSYSAPINSTISFIVRGEEIDGNDLQFKWYTENDVGTLSKHYELFQNYNSEKPFIKTSNNELISSGKNGKVVCEIIDSYNIKLIQEFNIIDHSRRRLNDVNTYPIYFKIRNGEIQILSDGIFLENNKTNENSDTNVNTNNVVYLNPTCNCNHGNNTKTDEENPILVAVLVMISLFFVLAIICLVIYIVRQKEKILPNNKVTTSDDKIPTPRIQSPRIPNNASNVNKLNKHNKLPKISADKRVSLEKEKKK